MGRHHLISGTDRIFCKSSTPGFRQPVVAIPTTSQKNPDTSYHRSRASTARSSVGTWRPAKGTGDFIEGTTADDVQAYTWDDPGSGLQLQGFAPANKFLPGDFYVYLVVDDGVNVPVVASTAAPRRPRDIADRQLAAPPTRGSGIGTVDDTGVG